jgi:hypothetical protein
MTSQPAGEPCDDRLTPGAPRGDGASSVALVAPIGQISPALLVLRIEARDDGNSGQCGLLGLSGPIGLADLLRRDRARSVTVADRSDRR